MTVSPILDAASSGARTGGPSFTLRLRLARVAFLVVWAVLAGWTPPMLRGWRRLILRAFGARMGRGATVYGSTRVWYPAHLVMGEFATLGPRVNCYNQAPVSLGNFAVVSQGATLCAGTHDYDDPEFQLRTRPIHLGAHCWVAAEAFVGPGVRVGERAVLGARGVAMRDLEPGLVYAGNRAVPVGRRAASGPKERAA